MGNGTWGARVPGGFIDDVGTQGTGQRGTTTLSPRPAGVSGEIDG